MMTKCAHRSADFSRIFAQFSDQKQCGQGDGQQRTRGATPSFYKHENSYSKSDIQRLAIPLVVGYKLQLCHSSVASNSFNVLDAEHTKATNESKQRFEKFPKGSLAQMIPGQLAKMTNWMVTYGFMQKLQGPRARLSSRPKTAFWSHLRYSEADEHRYAPQKPLVFGGPLAKITVKRNVP
jgi:hypothetical protein